MKKLLLLLIPLVLIIPFISSQNFDIEETSISRVTIISDAPVLNSITDFNIIVNNHFTFQVTATDSNNDTLSFSDDTTLFNINANTGLIDFTPTSTGVYDVNISVSDNKFVDWQIVKFTISQTPPSEGEGQPPTEGEGQFISPGPLPSTITSIKSEEQNLSITPNPEVPKNIDEKPAQTRSGIIGIIFKNLPLLLLLFAIIPLIIVIKTLRKIKPKEKIPIENKKEKIQTPTSPIIVTKENDE